MARTVEQYRAQKEAMLARKKVPDTRTTEEYRERHEARIACKKVPDPRPTVPTGCGMGWSDKKDGQWRGPGDINDDGNPNHDGSKWLLPG